MHYTCPRLIQSSNKHTNKSFTEKEYIAHTPLCTPIVCSSTKTHLDTWPHRANIYMSLPLTSSQASCPAENRSCSTLQTVNLQQIHFSFISFILFPQRGMWVSEVKIHLSPDVSDLPAFIPLAVSLSPHTTKHSLAFPLFESEALAYTLLQT